MSQSENKKIDSLKHKNAKRAHIPSKEEAGFEDTSNIVAAKQTAAYPLNPVTHRGQDPELFWMHKYGAADEQTHLNVDIRSLYRHEHVAPETLIRRLFDFKREASRNQDMFESELVDTLFGNYHDIEELDKPQSYYQHADRWSNRLIQGDSLLTMTSLLEREGMAGKVQMIYIDPPYGIKYGSNWQIKLDDRNVKDGDDAALSGEPEVVKAFRDTWELGIHSYLSYLRERLLVAKELLTTSGSCFVQISDENVHLVRCLMDEVFGSGNFISLIPFAKTAGAGSNVLGSEFDYLIWYAKDIESTKFRQLFLPKASNTFKSYKYAVSPDSKSVRPASKEEKQNPILLPDGWRLAQLSFAVSQDPGKLEERLYSFEGKNYDCGTNRHWKTKNPTGLDNLAKRGRLIGLGSQLNYIRYHDDFPATALTNDWTDTGSAGFSSSDPKVYVVQTDTEVIKRCILMTTDPGDLVLDPTCGSGATAHVAEQWGRRWITTDTSRIALNIAKTRLMTATYPWYTLKDEVALSPSPQPSGETTSHSTRPAKNAGQVAGYPVKGEGAAPLPPRGGGVGGEGVKSWDIRNGFIYKTVPHVTLKSLANDEPPETETLFDQPEVNKKKLRVAGPFTVETLQAFEPLSPEALSDAGMHAEAAQNFTQRIFEHLKSAGIKNGARNETAVFARVDTLGNEWLHAEGFYQASNGERKAYLHIGPQFGTVSRQAVNGAVKEARSRGDADWLIILGFAFESDIDTQQSTKLAGFEVTKVRMHDDLLQEGLLKKDKKAASFVTIGEPDITLSPSPSPASGRGEFIQVEIRGLDIYDPVKDEVKARSVADIAYWMVDDNYDGSNFMVRQVFFCGGDHDEFDKWKKGLSDLAKQTTKRKVEQTLKIEIDEEAFDRVYGF
ncbi:MAG: site-specific DNA-methyltransferase, partial [Gallionella sp.]